MLPRLEPNYLPDVDAGDAVLTGQLLLADLFGSETAPYFSDCVLGQNRSGVLLTAPNQLRSGEVRVRFSARARLRAGARTSTITSCRSALIVPIVHVGNTVAKPEMPTLLVGNTPDDVNTGGIVSPAGRVIAPGAIMADVLVFSRPMSRCQPPRDAVRFDGHALNPEAGVASDIRSGCRNPALSRRDCFRHQARSDQLPRAIIRVRHGLNPPVAMSPAVTSSAGTSCVNYTRSLRVADAYARIVESAAGVLV